MLLVRNAACHASCVEKTRLERPPESAEDAVDVEDVGVAKPWRDALEVPLTAPLTTLEVATLLLAIVKDVVGAEGAGGVDGAAGAGGAKGAGGVVSAGSV
jgi:hypothetical protein